MMETWVLPVLQEARLFQKAQVTLIATDQEQTLLGLKRGDVNLCISPHNQSFEKEHPIHLGSMTYVLAATPTFKDRYFQKREAVEDALLKAPCLVYDPQEPFIGSTLKKCGVSHRTAIHTLPSVGDLKLLWTM